MDDSGTLQLSANTASSGDNTSHVSSTGPSGSSGGGTGSGSSGYCSSASRMSPSDGQSLTTNFNINSLVKGRQLPFTCSSISVCLFASVFIVS